MQILNIILIYIYCIFLTAFHYSKCKIDYFYWLLTRKSKFADIHSGPRTIEKKKREGTGGRTHIEEENITKRFHSISIKEGSCSIISATKLTQVINSHHINYCGSWTPYIATKWCNFFPLAKPLRSYLSNGVRRTKLCNKLQISNTKVLNTFFYKL